MIPGFTTHYSTEVVLSVVKTFAGEEERWWNDKTYIAEIGRRFEEPERWQGLKVIAGGNGSGGLYLRK